MTPKHLIKLLEEVSSLEWYRSEDNPKMFHTVKAVTESVTYMEQPTPPDKRKYKDYEKYEKALSKHLLKHLNTPPIPRTVTSTNPLITVEVSGFGKTVIRMVEIYPGLKANSPTSTHIHSKLMLEVLVGLGKELPIKPHLTDPSQYWKYMFNDPTPDWEHLIKINV